MFLYFKSMFGCLFDQFSVSQNFGNKEEDVSSLLRWLFEPKATYIKSWILYSKSLKKYLHNQHN